jgi:hypothetical protein
MVVELQRQRPLHCLPGDLAECHGRIAEAPLLHPRMDGNLLDVFLRDDPGVEQDGTDTFVPGSKGQLLAAILEQVGRAGG